MNWKEFKIKQKKGIKEALILANLKVNTLKNKGLTKEEAINKILVEGYN